MQNLILISNLVKMLPKNLCEKSYERKTDRKMEFLTFISVCKMFWPVTFWVIFWTFFNGFKLSIEFCVLYYQNRLFKEKNTLLLALLLTLKPKSNEAAQKNVFY